MTLRITNNERRVLARLNRDGRPKSPCSTYWISLGEDMPKDMRKLRALLQGLERKGLVESHRSSAGYRYWWSLTDEGIAFASKPEIIP